MCVYCSSGVRCVGCSFGPQPTWPTTSMSGSFQWPGPAYVPAPGRSRCRSCSTKCRECRRSSASSWQHFATASSAAARTGMLLDRLKTMSRPLSRIAHRLVCSRNLSLDVRLRVPVVLQIIDAPRGPLFGIVVGERGAMPSWRSCRYHRPVPRSVGVGSSCRHVAGVGCDPGRRVDADLQPQRVDLVAQAFHVGEFPLGWMALNGPPRLPCQASSMLM